MTRPFIAVTGMHASGKSTATAYLASLGYFVHAELGWALRQHQLFEDPDSRTLIGSQLEWFDNLVLEAELQRDDFLASFSALPHCVETWHLGNLAYASVRSPGLAQHPPVPTMCETAYPLSLVCGAGRLWMNEQRAGRGQG